MRKSGIDLCKLIALIFVFFIHYIGWSGFFESVQNQIIYYYVMMILTQVVIACVPLFFIITGYLSDSVKVGSNYKKAIKVFNIYVFYALILILVSIYKFKTVYSIKNLLCNLLGIHSIINREWYISVYILLLFFIPFLNRLWDNLSKNMQRHLILLLFFTTALTESVHVVWKIDFFTLEFAGKMYVPLYFFIGKYIANYGIEIRKRFLFILLVSVVIFTALYFGFSYYGQIVDASYVIQYGRVGTVLIAVSLFGLLYDINIKDKLYSFIKFGAKASLDTYLGALSLEYLLFRMDLKGAQFLKRNFLCLVLIIFITIFFGNFRQLISKSIFGKGGGKKQYIYRQCMITIFLISALCVSVSNATYKFFPDNLSVNNGTIINQEIYATEIGCVTAGPYINLTPGTWTAEIYYETSNDGNYVDVAYCDENGEVKQYKTWKLKSEETCRKIEFDVGEGAANWEVRTFYGGVGEMKIKQICIKKY